MVSPAVVTEKPRQVFKYQRLQKTSVLVGGNIIIQERYSVEKT